MPKEISDWMHIDGLENYAVSRSGDVMNNSTGRILKQVTDRNGFQKVFLYRNGFRFTVYVHRLVAFCYLPGYRPGYKVKHKNDDKSDNRFENLELGVGCRSSEDSII